MKCNFELACFLLSLDWDQAEPQHHSYGHGSSCVILLCSSVLLTAQVDKVSLNTTLLLLSLSLFCDPYFLLHRVENFKSLLTLNSMSSQLQRNQVNVSV